MSKILFYIILVSSISFCEINDIPVENKIATSSNISCEFTANTGEELCFYYHNPDVNVCNQIAGATITKVEECNFSKAIGNGFCQVDNFDIGNYDTYYLAGYSEGSAKNDCNVNGGTWHYN